MSLASDERELPSGNLSFLFTDVEGSTARWETEPEFMRSSVARLENLARAHVADVGGSVVKGTGDGLLAVFTSADRALEAALRIQLESGPHAPPLRVAVNTGEAIPVGNDYFGPVLNRCHRVLESGHGGQVLVTRTTVDALEGSMPAEVTLIELGSYRLRGVIEPIEILQLVHPRLRADFPRLLTETEGPNNLPVELTRFVGRAQELMETARLLKAERMVTLIGGGGSGKTRLGLKLADLVLGRFPDGVWLVELAPLTEGTLVPKQLAQVLGVPEETGSSWFEALRTRLDHHKALVIFDNCEHLLGAVAELVDDLLRRCPDLKVLATSRHKLGVPGEAAYVVAPMSVPEPDGSTSLSEVGAHDSVRLFEQRARLVDSGFALTEGNATYAARIARAVDGIPLAIELAAGKVGTFTMADLAERLDQQLLALGGTTRGPARHRTLQATLDWSYDLLQEHERSLLAQLSVFRGSFELKAVEGVCRVKADAVETLESLNDKSLLVRNRADGRFRLLEPVRVYSMMRLSESAATADTTARHAAYFAAFFPTLNSQIDAEGQLVWLDRLAADHDNFRAAIRWALENGEDNLALRLAAGMSRFWRLRGHITEGRQWLERVIGAADDPDLDLLAHALTGAGSLAVSQGDDRAAESFLGRAIEIFRSSDNALAAAATARLLAPLPHRRGELAQAATLMEGAMESARAGGDLGQVGHIQAGLALIYEDLGRHEEAEATAEQALATGRNVGDGYVQADALLSRAELAINRGDTERASAAVADAATLAAEFGLHEVSAWAKAYAGQIALARGDRNAAVVQLEQALSAFQSQSQSVGEAWASRHLARAALGAGDLARADLLFRSALDLALKHVLPDAPLAMQGLGEVAVARADLEEGAVLLAAAENAAAGMGLVRHPGDAIAASRALDLVLKGIGPDALAAAIRRGGSLGLAAARSLIGEV
jgi:predicted ATPase/class 3 adenylate cyclase